MSGDDGMTPAEKRHDQLTTAPKATEDDAEARIEVSDAGDDTKRIDIHDDAVGRPGNPDTDD